MRYNVITIKTDGSLSYRIYDKKENRYFRRVFRSMKDVMFFIDILNKADRNKGDNPDAQSETTEDKDDND